MIIYEIKEHEIDCHLNSKMFLPSNGVMYYLSISEKMQNIFVVTSASWCCGDRKAEHLQQNLSPEGRKLCRNIKQIHQDISFTATMTHSDNVGRRCLQVLWYKVELS